jgi:hypothetical protein
MSLVHLSNLNADAGGASVSVALVVPVKRGDETRGCRGVLTKK